MTEDEWEQQVADIWASFDELDAPTFLVEMERVATSSPSPDGSALFERASAHDCTGHPDLAVSLYQAALERGLSEDRRRRAIIQMASCLRNIGQPQEAISLLMAERGEGSDSLDDAVVGFLALAMADTGREREALSMTLGVLAPHLPRYQRSLASHARILGESTASS